MTTTQQPEALNLEEFRAKVTRAAREPLLARIEELEAQLSAIGAGGVEPLRKQVVPETLVVPDGYALMPIEPTAGICKAAADGWLDCGSKMVLNKAGAAYRSSVAYFMKKGTQS